MNFNNERNGMREQIISILFILTIALGTVKYGFAEKEKWNPVSLGPITTWTSPLCGKGKFVVQPFFFYNRTRGAFDNEGHEDSLPEGDKKWQRQYQLFMQYGLTEKLEIDGQTVYQENYRRQTGNAARSDSLGDSYLFLRYCLTEEREYFPDTAALFQLKLPTGKYQKLDAGKLGTDSMGATSGGGSYDHGYGLIMTKKLRPFLLHADAIYSFPIERKVDGVSTRYGNYLNYDFGVEYFLPKGFNLMLELNGFLQGDKKQSGSKAPATDIRSLTLGTGVGWSCGKVQTLAAYQRTISGTNIDANDSMMFSLVYAF